MFVLAVDDGSVKKPQVDGRFEGRQADRKCFLESGSKNASRCVLTLEVIADHRGLSLDRFSRSSLAEPDVVPYEIL